jgi:cystathionine beta-synthase
VKLVGVDPVGSLYYDFVKTGRLTKAFSYKVEGIGEDFVPSTIDLSLLDEVVRVDDGECFRTARDLVRYEGLYVGGSSGAAVAAAIKYAKKQGKRQDIVVILADSAAKYLSKIFNDDWMRENGFLDAAPSLGTVADLLKSKRGVGVITADAGEPLRKVIDRMKETGISQLPVVEGPMLRGVVTEVDLLRCIVGGDHALDAPVGSLVEGDFTTVTPETRVELLTGVLAESRMALVRDDAGGLVGVITKIDLIDYLAHPPPTAMS